MKTISPSDVRRVLTDRREYLAKKKQAAGRSPMTRDGTDPVKVYASTTDQVLLALLWAVRDQEQLVCEKKLAAVFEAFQQRTGTVLYGSVCRPDGEELRSDLATDLESLNSRGLIYRTENPHAGITILGMPAANSLVLVPPLDQLVEIAREILV